MKSKGLDSKESWIVATSISVVFLLMAWPIRLGNQLYVSILDQFEADRKAVSFSFVLTYLTRSLSGPFAGYFGNKCGLQNVCLCGCILSIIGTGGCFFARNISEMYIFFGVIYGMGFGWSTAVGPELINQHFEKHRSKANGLVFASSGLVAFFTPPLLDVILDKYGVSGSFLVMSAILLNSIPAIIIIINRRSAKNIKAHHNLGAVKTSEKKCETSHKEINTLNTDGYSNNAENQNELKIEQNKCIAKNDLSNLTDLGKVGSKSSNEANGHTNTLSTSPRFKDTPILIPLSQYSKTDSIEYITKDNSENIALKEVGEKPVLLSVRKLNELVPIKSIDKELKKTEDSINVKNSSFLTSIDVLWSPMFLFVTFIQSSHFYIMYLSWTITIDVIRDKGIVASQEVYFVMSLALFDTFGRAFLAILTDSGILSRANYTAICFGVIGSLCLAITWVTGFVTSIIVVSLLGLICGGNTTGLPGIVNQFISKEKRAMAMSSRLLMYAPMSSTIAPLIGYFRGDLGSYNGLFYLVAVLSFVCSTLLLLVPRIRCNAQK